MDFVEVGRMALILAGFAVGVTVNAVGTYWLVRYGRWVWEQFTGLFGPPTVENIER